MFSTYQAVQKQFRYLMELVPGLVLLVILKWECMRSRQNDRGMDYKD